jgi:hypothetical protein
MIISIRSVWHAAEAIHAKYVSAKISDALSAKNHALITDQTLRKLLVERASDIATGRPYVLRQIIADVEKTLSSKPEDRAEFHKQARTIFRYKSFASKDTSGWNGYQLCKLAAQTLCPYCHQAYAFTIMPYGSNKSFRPTLDHFYTKSKYPYLALSLFNLVPSCYVCNSSLKGETDFYSEPHLHPLEDEEAISFGFDLDKYLEWRSAPSASIGVVPVVKSPRADVHMAANRSIETFLLRERYEPHMPEFLRFAQSVYSWTPAKIADWQRDLGVEENEATLLSFDRSLYRDEMLGAIKRGIYDALRQDDVQ